MNWIDTHTHIYLPEFEQDRNEVIERAKEVGVEHLLLPNVDLSTVDDLLALCDQNPQTCFPMIGLHPCSVKEDFREVLEKLKVIIETERTRIIAIGEIGVDLYWDASTLKIQEEAFRQQIEWALTYELPIAVHIRNAFEDTLRIVQDYDDRGLRGVFHCFTGNAEQAKWLQSRGYYLGIGGVATFKNGGVREILHLLDQSLVILETDAPYLAPTPFRGKRNEPMHIPRIAETLAEAWNAPLNQVAEITSNNAKRLFNHA
ncbi:MAG: TatD family deoxyribonuclease [Flavobacteriales bacterium]|nr:MAG: TatD family deoxyribonuclease [Flavobacteriales bacterium]